MGEVVDIDEVREMIDGIDPVSISPELAMALSASEFDLRRWEGQQLVVSALDVEALRSVFGFDEFGVNPFTEASRHWDTKDKSEFIAVKAVANANKTWGLTCGFWVRTGGTWYFKPNLDNGFERVEPPNRYFRKKNPTL